MGGTFTQIAMMLGVLQFMVHVNDQTLKVAEETLKVADETLKVANETLKVADHALKVTEELLQQKEQRSQEMALLLLMERSSQEVPEWLLACQHWWFWAFAEMLLMLFGFYWLPRQGSSGYHSSACRGAPEVPGRKRTRRRRRRRMHALAEYSDKLDELRLPDLRLEWEDMQNSEEEEIEGMVMHATTETTVTSWMKSGSQICVLSDAQCRIQKRRG